MGIIEFYALIPAYEPDERLAGLAERLNNSGFRVVIVNDGSSSKFARFLDEAKAYADVIAYPENRGKGYALKTGLSYIKEHCLPDSVVVTLDSDGQHSIKDAVLVCREAANRPGTLVLGCRRIKENTPLKSRVGNTITRVIFRLFTRKNVYDTQTGLRAFSTALIPFMCGIEGNRYEYEMNVLLACTRLNIPITEVEIETIYIDGNSGSHFRAVRDSFLIYGEILKFAASSLISFFVDYALYSLFVILTAGLGSAGILVSNISARVVSSALNFTINRNLVFKSQGRFVGTAAAYFALALCILIGNTLLLALFVNVIGINKFVAKPLAEAALFILSWLTQKFLIFNVKRRWLS